MQTLCKGSCRVWTGRGGDFPTERIKRAADATAGHGGALWWTMSRPGDTRTIKPAAIQRSARRRASWRASSQTSVTPQGKESIRPPRHVPHILSHSPGIPYCPPSRQPVSGGVRTADAENKPPGGGVVLTLPVVHFSRLLPSFPERVSKKISSLKKR